MSEKDASVVVATYGRPDTLDCCLNALANQKTEYDYEVLVIDDTPDDSVKEVAKQYDIVKYFRGDSKGLSGARNKGYSLSKGEKILYIDDDGVAEKKWLQRTVESFKDEVAVVGGKVVPVYPEKKPEWLSKRMEMFLSVRDQGDLEKLLEIEDANIAGCNMAFRRVTLEKYGGFDTDFGRKENNLISWEEAEFMQRLADRTDDKALYIPTVVQHKIPEERLKKDFFRKRLYSEGVSNALFSLKKDNSRLPREIAKKLILTLYHLGLFLVYLAKGNEKLMYENKFWLYAHKGYFTMIIRGLR